MKKNKKLNLLLIGVMILSFFGFISPVYAASATVGFTGNSTVAKGDNITVSLAVSNISGANGGVTSVSANLVFDSNYLEYVSGNLAYSDFQGGINVANNYKMSAMGADGITSQANVFTFTFKALKAGTTEVTVSGLKTSDNSGKFTSTIQPKTITITDPSTAKSNNANLSNLKVNGYSLNPTFNKNTLNYTVEVPNGTTSVPIEATKEDSKASVQITGNGTVTLNGDSTVATVKVTAEDGTIKEYKITINKQTSSSPTNPETKSSDATLKSLDVRGYNLSPAFDKTKTSYTVKVPTTLTSVKIDASATDSKATITGDGTITLSGNETTATIKVKAEDGTVKNYTVNIVKDKSLDTGDKDSDATLKSLDVAGYTLTPTFKPGTNNYSMKVKNNITSLKVTAVPNKDTSKVSITGNSNWKEGVNVVTVKVTAEDGSTNTYTINVTREGSGTTTTAKSSDNYLESLVINSSHEISPKFNKNTSNYNVTVPYSVTKLDLSYVTSNGKAKVKVTGNDDFKVNAVNTVEVEVTAEDGSVRIYTLNVTRSTDDSDNDLEDIKIGGGATLSPAFDPEKLEYTVTVPEGKDKLDLSAIAENKDAKVEIIGNNNLKEGHNTILIKVTDKNGFTKYYTIDAVKEGNNKSNGLAGGFNLLQLGLIFGILLLFLILFLLLFLRRKKDKEEKVVEKNIQAAPTIEFKPEFNFSSKNSSDDDVVHGDFNQDSTLSSSEAKKLAEPKVIDAIEADYSDVDEDNVPYDPYDETVTKREIIDAIREATKTKDASKLKMLLEQDELNQRKKEMKKREEELKAKSASYDEDDE